MSDFLRLHELQHTRLPCPPPPGVCSDSHSLSRWCYPTISSSVAPFSSCPQFFIAELVLSKCLWASPWLDGGWQPLLLLEGAWWQLSTHDGLKLGLGKALCTQRQEFHRPSMSTWVALSLKGGRSSWKWENIDAPPAALPFEWCGEWGLLSHTGLSVSGLKKAAEVPVILCFLCPRSQRAFRHDWCGVCPFLQEIDICSLIVQV